MGNLVDYIHWRGDLTLERDPFNEADNLVLSYLAYANLDGIAPAPGEGYLTLVEVSEAFFERHSEEELEKDKSFVASVPYAMRDMAACARFRKIRIQNYINRRDVNLSLQLAAMEIVLDDGSSYVAFRGTDDFIVGWKEDFFLSSKTVSAQKEAAEYLDLVGGRCRGAIRVGGHSKGGNLAVYAAVNCAPKVQEKIVEVYTNDGPGFTKGFIDSPKLKKMLPKIRRYIPESSVIGMLLEHAKEPVILASTAKGVLQHDGLSWEIMGTQFVRCGELGKAAKIFDETMRSWLDPLNDEQRESFINDFFSVLEAPGAETLTELQKGGLRSFYMMMKQKEDLAPETKQMIDSLLHGLLSRWTEFLPFQKEERRDGQE